MKSGLMVSLIAAIVIVAAMLVFFFTAGEPAPFTIDVTPESIEDSVPGQMCVFLVTVADAGDGWGAGGAVNLAVSTTGANVTVEPQSIIPGEVAEVIVVPDEIANGDGRTATTNGVIVGQGLIADDGGETITIIISSERGGLVESKEVTLDVHAGTGTGGELAQTARQMLDSFVPWLDANRPELGITTETEFTGTIIRPHFMVVMYYLFFTDDWEIGLRWHVTIPPHNWAEIYLRDRYDETAPSIGFKIDSVSTEPVTVYELEPEDSIWR